MKTTLINSLATLSLLISAPLAAQKVAKEKWGFHGYGPLHHKDEADGITVTPDGHTYISGGFSNAISFNGEWKRSQGKRDIFLEKLDKKGKKVWFKTFASKLDENIYDLTHDKYGNLYLNGFEEVYVTENKKKVLKQQAITLKVSGATGNLIWKKSFPSDGHSGGNEIVTDGKGNIFASVTASGALKVGRKKIAFGGAKDSHLIKLDQAGNVKWVTSATGRGAERIRAVASGYNGDRIVVGYQFVGELKVGKKVIPGITKSATQGAYALLDRNGGIIDVKGIEGSFHANVRGAGGFNKGLYIHGTFLEAATRPTKINGQRLKGMGSRDSFVLKIDKQGKAMWSMVLGNDKTEDGGEMAVDQKGNFTLTGDHSGKNYSYQIGRRSGVLFKDFTPTNAGHFVQFSASGRPQEKFTLGASRHKSAIGVVETNGERTSVGIRFHGEVKANGKTYQTYTPSDKDFLILGF